MNAGQFRSEPERLHEVTLWCHDLEHGHDKVYRVWLEREANGAGPRAVAQGFRLTY